MATNKAADQRRRSLAAGVGPAKDFDRRTVNPLGVRGDQFPPRREPSERGGDRDRARRARPAVPPGYPGQAERIRRQHAGNAEFVGACVFLSQCQCFSCDLVEFAVK